MITKAELIEKIEDLDLDDAELMEYIIIDDSNSEAFNISFKANPEKVLNLSSADDGILGFLNKRSRRKRQKKYNRKIRKGFKGIRIVSEGDSWFQYPVFLKDIIDHLNDNDAFAIYSLGYGGDWLSNIYIEQEYLKAIREKQPKVFLMSGGGNDLAGKRRLSALVHGYSPELSPEQYLNEESQLFFDDIKMLYKKIIDNVINVSPDIKIICHGYDYAIPQNQKWLGKPLHDRGIIDPNLQAEIIKVLMNKFNEIQIEVIANYDNVYHVDLRNTVIESTGWHDELHPKNDYFERIAEKIENKIFEALNIA
jgi:hypothetical protein